MNYAVLPTLCQLPCGQRLNTSSKSTSSFRELEMSRIGREVLYLTLSDQALDAFLNRVSGGVGQELSDRPLDFLNAHWIALSSQRHNDRAALC